MGNISPSKYQLLDHKGSGELKVLSIHHLILKGFVFTPR